MEDSNNQIRNVDGILEAVVLRSDVDAVIPHGFVIPGR